jgi:hypothetical protein
MNVGLGTSSFCALIAINAIAEPRRHARHLQAFDRSDIVKELAPRFEAPGGIA